MVHLYQISWPKITYGVDSFKSFFKFETFFVNILYFRPIMFNCMGFEIVILSLINLYSIYFASILARNSNSVLYLPWLPCNTKWDRLYTYCNPQGAKAGGQFCHRWKCQMEESVKIKKLFPM